MVTELKLDIDLQEHEYLLEREFRIDKVILLLGLTVIKEIQKPTKHGYHIYIKIKETLTDTETCLLQSLMGSDYKRECFNIIRIKHHIKNWNVLFQKKYNYNLQTKMLKLIGEEHG